jgi:hypothetical protein
LDPGGGTTQLLNKYVGALQTLQSMPDYYTQSAAMTGGGMSANAVNTTLGSHFRGDWISAKYPLDPAGGLFWPQVASAIVISTVQLGTMVAIHKAIGKSNLTALYAGAPMNVESYADALFDPYNQDDADPDAVRPLSTCWVCIAPSDSTFFQADAVRGPSVVELVIATPKPLGNSPLAILLGRRAEVDSDTVATWGETILSMPITPPAGS